MTAATKTQRVMGFLQAIHRARRWWLMPVVAFLLATPLIAAGGWLHQNDRWAPIFDLAITEMRVRDVGTAHTPLIGLPGRLGRPEMGLQPGSHPGPLSFYLLTPVYRLLGGSFWALRIAMITLNVGAIICALWIARRRGGAACVIAVGGAIGLLESGYGLLRLTEPWNPNLPLLWFVVFLLTVWSIVCEDTPMLPLMAVSGSFCAQTHIPYVPVCGGLALFALIGLGVARRADWRRGFGQARHFRAWLAALAVTAVVWAPPVVDEIIHEPGNLAILLDYFRHPTESIGFRAALGWLLEHLDAWHLVVDQMRDPGTLGIMMHPHLPKPARGVVLLVLWLAATALAAKLRSRSLLIVHALVAASLVVALVAISRIMGVPWPYLRLWAWAIGALSLVATLSTAALATWKWIPQTARIRRLPLQELGIAAIALCAFRLAIEADAAGSSVSVAAAQLADLAPKTATALRQSAGAAALERSRYLITWSNDVGPQGVGMVNELEKRGIRAALPKEFSILVGEQRVIDLHQAAATVTLATGAWRRQWRQSPGAIKLASSDLRSAADRREARRLRTWLIRALRAKNRNDLVPMLDRNVLALHTAAPDPYTALAIGKMFDLGQRVEVYLLPTAAPSTERRAP